MLSSGTWGDLLIHIATMTTFLVEHLDFKKILKYCVKMCYGFGQNVVPNIKFQDQKSFEIWVQV